MAVKKNGEQRFLKYLWEVVNDTKNIIYKMAVFGPYLDLGMLFIFWEAKSACAQHFEK